MSLERWKFARGISDVKMLEAPPPFRHATTQSARGAVTADRSTPSPVMVHRSSRGGGQDPDASTLLPRQRPRPLAESVHAGSAPVQTERGEGRRDGQLVALDRCIAEAVDLGDGRSREGHPAAPVAAMARKPPTNGKRIQRLRGRVPGGRT